VQKSQPGLVAQQDIDVSEGKDLEASAGVSAAKDSLASAEQGLAAAKATLDKDKALYAYSHITAPFDGVVTVMYAYTGALLPAGTSSNIGNSALCRLSQNNLLRLVIPVPERAVPDLHLGEMISVKVSSLGKTSPGKIVRFSDQIDTQTRTMHTEVEVPNPNYELVPGMYASVEIPLHKAAKVLAVPIQVVQPGGQGKGTVLLVNDSNEIERRAVTLGLQTATEIEIVSGLKENDRVIFGSQGQYQPGQRVAPKIMESQEMEQ
jgi:RND family efflux transporter MFP subunit